MSISEGPEIDISRPSLGLLFLGAVVAWICVVVVESVFWNRFIGDVTDWGFGMTLALAVAVIVIIFLIRQEIRELCLILLPVLAVAFCATICASLYWNAWDSDIRDIKAAAGDGSELSLDLTSDPSEKDYGTVSEAKTTIQGCSVRIRIKWPESDDGLSTGHRIIAAGTIRLPEADEGGRWNHQQGFVGMMNVVSYRDEGVSDDPRGWVAPLRDVSFERIESLGSVSSGLLAGILLGNRTLYAGTELEQDFRVTGLAHLMAVSGTHLAVVTVLTLWMLRFLPFGKGLRSAVLLWLLVSYVTLTAFAPSAMRACTMCAVALGASRFGRRKHGISALSACVVVFLALEPRLAFSLGFQLSVLCMVGLMVFSPLGSVWIANLFPKGSRNLAQGLAATLCANLMTMPVTIPLFSQLPLISPLSTLVVSPLITAALGVGISGILLAVICDPLGSLVLHVAGAIGGLTCWVVHGLASFPFTCVPLDNSASWLAVLDVLLLLILWLTWPLPRSEGPRRVIKTFAALVFPVAALLVLEFGGISACVRALGITVESDAQVVMLDVGQGDAMLIRDGESVVLVDTGEEGTALLKALARNGVNKLDAVALSHKDVDHTGALGSLAGVVTIDHVFVHRDLVKNEVMGRVQESADRVTDGKGLEGVGVGSKLKVGRFFLTLMSPEMGGQSENKDSLIWLLTFDENGDGVPEAKGLLTGDGEQEAIEKIVPLVGNVSFLKVAHHGSSGAVSAEELDILRPELALISVGQDNSYGHPTRNTLSTLGQADCKVLRTDISGDVRLSFCGSAIGVKTQKSELRD